MSENRPNILFLMSDQHSFRFLGHRDGADGEPVETPALDALASTATSFDEAYCSTPLCTPSRLSMLTGREPKNVGAWGNWSMLNPGVDTIPACFSDVGYETCLLGKMHLGGNRQFAGFDHRPYGDLTGQTGHQLEHQRPNFSPDLDFQSFITEAGITGIPESLLQEQKIATEAVTFLREHQHRNPEQPWFLCASFSRPHWPRTAPQRYFERYWPDNVTRPKVEPDEHDSTHPLTAVRREAIDADDITDEETMRARAAYFACVSYLDEIIGDMLALLRTEGLLEDTIIIYTSDHGEMAGEHCIWDKSTWHEASTRVPLLVQLPEHRNNHLRPTNLSTPVSLIDLFPTLCGLIDVDPPEGIDGTDLSESIYTGTEPNRGPVVVDSFVPYQEGLEYRMVRDGQYKYIRFRDAPELLFDLDVDPLEQHNIASTAAGRDEDTLTRLRDFVADTIDFETIDEKQERDRRLKDAYRLGISKGTPNQYHWPDGRIIDADTPIYHPHVLAEEPDVIYDDYPSGQYNEEE